MIDKILSVDDLAKITGLSKATLNNYRYSDRGPKFFKLEGKLCYLERDVQAWITAAHSSQNGPVTPQPAAEPTEPAGGTA